MGITVTGRGTSSASDTAATASATTTADIRAGRTIVVGAAAGYYASDGTPDTCVDSAGNAYVRYDPGALPFGQTLHGELWVCERCLALAAGSTVTLSWPGTGTYPPPGGVFAKLLAVYEVRGARTWPSYLGSSSPAASSDARGMWPSFGNPYSPSDYVSSFLTSTELQAITFALDVWNGQGDVTFADPSGYTALDNLSAGNGNIPPGFLNSWALPTLYARAAYKSFPLTAALLTDVLTISASPAPPASGFGSAAHPDVRSYAFTVSLGVLAEAQGSPCCVERRNGQYCVAYHQAGSIRFRRSRATYPPFEATVTVTDGATFYDTSPQLCEGPGERLDLVFYREDDDASYLTDSDSDGDSWSAPVSLFAPGTHPAAAFDRRSQMRLFAARVAGKLEIRQQGPGDDTPQAAFTAQNAAGADLTIDDDSFQIAPAQDGPARFELAVTRSGAVEYWESTDDGATWKQVT